MPLKRRKFSSAKSLVSPMSNKPKTAREYESQYLELSRATCLYVATKLGDLLDDLVVVGGLVPSLLIDPTTLGENVDAHVGTMDVDVGLTVALLEEGRYRTLTERLRAAGLEMDTNDRGHRTRQRWRVVGAESVTLDFLIAPSLVGDSGGALRNIEHDFAALIAPGLHLAFHDHEYVRLEGRTIFNEKAVRTIKVAGPAAFVILKALAWEGRGENKDAYDLYYVLRNYGLGVEDVVARLRPLRSDPSAARALAVLRRDFLEPEALGPLRVAAFLGGPDPNLQADVVGFVSRLLTLCELLEPAI